MVNQTQLFKNLFKNLGIGVGLRPHYYSEFLPNPPSSVQWVEAISENFMRWQGSAKGGLWPNPPLQKLLQVRNHFPVALHGVSLSIGSADPLDFDYLKRLKELIQKIEPFQVSDHLCWTGVDSENLHDLLPLPYTMEALKHVVEKILKTQDFLGQRILIENVSSYIEYKHSEMTEWQFLSEVSERSDCGILLDINNIYVSSHNHGFSANEYLTHIPHHRVGQIHLAGHSISNDGFLIDTHDAAVCQEVWHLYKNYCQSFGPKSAMIERDDHFPVWHELEKEIQTLRSHTVEAIDVESQNYPATI